MTSPPSTLPAPSHARPDASRRDGFGFPGYYRDSAAERPDRAIYHNTTREREEVARLVLLGLGARPTDERTENGAPSGASPSSAPLSGAAPSSGDFTEIIIDAHEASILKPQMERWCAAGQAEGLRCSASMWARLAQQIHALSPEWRGHDRRGRRVPDRLQCGARQTVLERDRTHTARHLPLKGR